MKRTPIAFDLKGCPAEFSSLLSGVTVYDSSCSAEARVFFIDRDGGYYLKTAPHGTLRTEAMMDAYFYSKGISSKVEAYVSGERDWLLTHRVCGEDCTDPRYLEDGRRLAILLGERLRALHEMDGGDCPVQRRMDAYLALAKENYLANQVDLSYCEDFGIEDAQDAWKCVEENGKYLKNDTLLHGDYCLPNVILDDWKFSGFIDLGNGGMGDRHVDLFWGAWTLRFNLKTDRYRELFFEAYGKERIERDVLRVIAAAEAFG